MKRRIFLKRITAYIAGFLSLRKFSWRKTMVYAEGKSPNILRVYHAHATDWDFIDSQTGGSHYWEHVNIDACREMVNKGLKIFTKKPDLDEAWKWVFHQNGGTGYIKGQNISIKLNWNDCDSGLGDGPNGNYLVSNTQLVQAVVESLLSHVSGLKPENLLIGDPSRAPYDRIRSALSDLGVQIIEFKSDVFTVVPDALVAYPNWQDDYVCDSMFGQSAHLIDMPLLKAISPSWGIAGVLKDAQGKIGLANTSYQGNRKAWIKKHNNTFSYTDSLNTLVYMNSHPWIRDKRRLIIADGLYGLFNGQHFHSAPKDDVPRPWILFENTSPNSVLFSIDPVAVDCIMHDLVRFERMHQELSGSFQKPIQLACATAGLGTNDDPIESEVEPSSIGPLFSYPSINYKVVDVTPRKPGTKE
jgi:hypothetical protein